MCRSSSRRKMGQNVRGIWRIARARSDPGGSRCQGTQRNDLSNPLSVLACAKHFVGDGGTAIGTASFLNPEKKRLLDQGDTQVSEAELREIHLQGYITTVKAG